MSTITPDSLANIHYRLKYSDAHATHTQLYYARRVNFWRDILPDNLKQALLTLRAGETVALEFGPGDFERDYNERKRFDIRPAQFRRKSAAGYVVEPRYGRFYPKGLLRNIPGVFSENIEPFRCLKVNDDRIEVDFNHPMAGRSFQLSAVVDSVFEKIAEQGGSSVDWIETVTDGPGMQSRSNGLPTDFLGPGSFSREDETPDAHFYRKPRFVHHTDRRAVETITQLYADLLRPGMRVLDLMTSWLSHLPQDLELDSVTGLGLNAAELEANERLNRRVQHDLNLAPTLPFESDAFDAVICTVSVEYLARPFEVFKEVARVLRNDGLFVVTFSNRWFPPKAIRVWTELLEFERLGLVSEYFMDSGRFKNLETFAVRGYPRPVDDKYFPQLRYSDPVYAVYGRKI
jgi:SAM-dependent methyltransferase/FKBP-type peptidyl-prolyl cis-trans isomerase 2